VLNISHSRPLGVTIIAIIMVIFGILGAISGIGLLSISSTLGIITLILGVLEIALALGLWSLQKWAYWVTVVLEVLTLLGGIFSLTAGNMSIGVVDIVVALAILIYLFADPNVRTAFRT
jgi:uncharacterized membrane protein (DUF2068 family)